MDFFLPVGLGHSLSRWFCADQSLEPQKEMNIPVSRGVDSSWAHHVFSYNVLWFSEAKSRPGFQKTQHTDNLRQAAAPLWLVPSSPRDQWDKQSQWPPKKWFPRVLLPLAPTGHCLHEVHDSVPISQGFHSLMQLSYDNYYHPSYFLVLDNGVLVNVNNQCPQKVQIKYK